jgi:hypothetical protein
MQSFIRAVETEMVDIAVGAMDTVIETSSVSPHLLENTMVLYFFRNSCAVFLKFLGNGLERKSSVERMFNDIALF